MRTSAQQSPPPPLCVHFLSTEAGTRTHVQAALHACISCALRIPASGHVLLLLGCFGGVHHIAPVYRGPVT